MTKYSVSSLEQGLNSDALLLGCLLAVSAVLLRTLPLPDWSLGGLWATATRAVRRELSSSGPFALETAAATYAGFDRAASADVQRMRSAYARLSWSSKTMGNKIGYPAKLDQLAQATRANARLAEGIAKLAVDEFGLEEDVVKRLGGTSLHRTRESMRHFVRDWSAEGEDERGRIFGPVLDVLRDVPPERRANVRVLVPGSGLGRLAWEISELGLSLTCITRG